MNQAESEALADTIFADRLSHIQKSTDRVFAFLIVLQWIFAIGIALIVSPKTWVVAIPYWHIHVWAAIFVGGTLTILPLYCALARSGRLSTRIIISISQISFSCLLIHLTGGRIETHFHIFGSLAFLSFYRDWRVFVPVTLIVAVDHLLRGIFWPESVFGVITAAPWRAFEHAGWVLFEDVFLIWGCLNSLRELREMAEAQAQLEQSKNNIERTVQLRTHELEARTVELQESLTKGRQLEMKLLEAQKLESMGLLAAGVAHEINTPMQYVNDNIEFLSECSESLFEVISVYHRNLLDTNPPKSWAERIREIEEIQNRCRFDRMKQQIPAAIEECLEGVQRVVEIVRAMKQLSHPGTEERVSTDINSAIRSTATITRNRWKYAAELILELSPELPDVKTLTAEINQVLINLVVNAADAIAEKYGDSGDKGKITIRTRGNSESVIIEIEDNGCGIPEEHRRKVFEPFFTTKEVGKGTGQGLAISYNAIVNHHQGSLHVESVPGKGTCFVVELPTNPQAAPPFDSEGNERSSSDSFTEEEYSHC